MFTGLIEELGSVRVARERGGGREFEIEAPGMAEGLSVGDSVAVNGVCQTATAVEADRFHFFAMAETLRATTLGRLAPGRPVNLEPALTPASPMGGHFVTGHVDGVGRIAELTGEGDWRRLRLSMAADLVRQLVPKGSLAVDGISLSVGPEILRDGCDLFLIPHTLAATTLGAARVGDEVNLETDILGKYVLRYLERGEGGDAGLEKLLLEHGFTKGEQE